MIQIIERRTLPNRLRYVADQLEALKDFELLALALVLRQTADELERELS